MIKQSLNTPLTISQTPKVGDNSRRSGQTEYLSLQLKINEAQFYCDSISQAFKYPKFIFKINNNNGIIFKTCIIEGQIRKQSSQQSAKICLSSKKSSWIKFRYPIKQPHLQLSKTSSSSSSSKNYRNISISIELIGNYHGLDKKSAPLPIASLKVSELLSCTLNKKKYYKYPLITQQQNPQVIGSLKIKIQTQLVALDIKQNGQIDIKNNLITKKLTYSQISGLLHSIQRPIISKSIKITHNLFKKQQQESSFDNPIQIQGNSIDNRDLLRKINQISSKIQDQNNLIIYEHQNVGIWEDQQQKTLNVCRNNYQVIHEEPFQDD